MAVLNQTLNNFTGRRTKFSVPVIVVMSVYPKAKADKEDEKEPDSEKDDGGYLAGRGRYPSENDSTKCVDSDRQ